MGKELNPLPNNICTHQNLSQEMRFIKFSEVLRSKHNLIPVRRLNLVLINKKKGLVIE